jgi:death-on-curing protein
MKEIAWLDEHDALLLHDRLLALHGGAPGVRDLGLLASALARPRQWFSYTENPSIIHGAALYTAGIVSNHPFVDGNKRTGFVIGVLFLELNGHAFAASEEIAAQAVIVLASGSMDEVAYAKFLFDNLG